MDVHYSRFCANTTANIATVHICMVAERNLPNRSEAMAHPGSPRQPSLAEEIDAVEQEQLMTTALQAVETHGMLYDNVSRGVNNTPNNTPTKGEHTEPRQNRC